MRSSETGPDVRGVDVAGPPDAPPIVFVHGATFQRKAWAPQRDALSDAFRVVALDVPGHGARSDEEFRLERAVDLLGAVFEAEVDGGAVLVGLSLGGYVATEYAGRHGEDVDGLVVAGSSANPVGGLAVLTRVVAGAARLLTRSESVVRALRWLTARWVRERDLDPETIEEIVDAGFYPRQFGVAGPEIAGRDFRAAFASYPGPALVLNGEADALNRRGERRHAAAAESARVEVIDDAGHVCNLSAPGAFTDAVRRFGGSALPERTPERGE